MRLNSSNLSRLALVIGLSFTVLSLLLFVTPGTTVAQNSDETELQPGDEGYCLVCHVDSEQTFKLADGSVHSVNVEVVALAASVHGRGNSDGALECTDCHETTSFPHDAPLPDTDRDFTVSRSVTCIKCHTEDTENLADDLHYTAILDGNLRAATCVDCHGSHAIFSPNETTWKPSQACGRCHTTTFEEYKESVHGEAILSGNEDVPNCIDCHGVHGIQHPTTSLFRNRSPELCAECHADEELMAKYDISTNVFNSYLTDFHGSTVALFNQTAADVPANKAVCYDCHGVHNIAPSNDAKSQVVKENLLTTCQKCHPGATSDFPDSWIGHFEPTPESHLLVFSVDWFYKIIIPLTLGGFAFLIGTDIFRIIREKLFSSGRESKR